MLKKILTFIFPLIITLSINAQSDKAHKIHAFSGKWVFTMEGGLTLGYTDYIRIKPAGSLRGAVEYFLPTTNRHIFGLKLFAGGQQIGGEDDRTEIPPTFKTDMYIMGLAASYSLSIEDQYFPFIQMGFSNIWFNPKDEDGKRLKGNSNKLYNKSASVFDVILGSRFLLTDIISLNISVGAHLPSTDYLDDIAAGTNNDIYYSVLLGISVSPFKPGDADQDGILDVYDACPEEAEDFDGFQDDDGCPDYDNDYDGIPDLEDNCPNDAEDYDGFEDSDGCPDPDNDQDRILDIHDECPDEAEDFDGFEDDDGCPDYDNDNDGIPDVDDECPNQPETFNGFEDQDGCPDQLNIVTINQMRI